MAKTTTSEKPADKKADTPKQKRRMPTPEERVARLEQELQAAREKAQGKDRKRYATVVEKIGKLRDKRKELDSQLEELGVERDQIVQRVPELVNEQPQASSA